MTFSLKKGEKFACIAFDNIAVDATMPEAIDLGDGMWVLQTPPVAFNQTWQRWLGTIRSERLSDCNLFLVTKQLSRKPGEYDDENTALLGNVEKLFLGILLQGVPEYADAYIFSGAEFGGAPEVIYIDKLHRHYQTEGSMKPQVGQELCGLAKVAMDELVAVEIDPEYKRLKRGTAALFRGIRERYVEDRVHEFVRALEALIKPEIGKTTNQFIHRFQTFALASQANAKILGECYEIRTVVEHMHPFEDSLTSYPPAQQNAMGLQRCRQIETLALGAYLRISTSPSHAPIFRTDPDIDAFWRTPDHQRVALWGPRVDIAAIP